MYRVVSITNYNAAEQWVWADYSQSVPLTHCRIDDITL